MKLNLTGVIGAVAVGSTLLLAEVRAQDEDPLVIDHTTFPPGDYSCFCGLGGTFNPDMVPNDMNTVFPNIESNNQRTCAEAASGTMISRMVGEIYEDFDNDFDAHSIALEEAWTGWESQTCEARVEQFAATAYCAGNSVSSMEVCSQFTSEDACSGHGQFPASEDDLMQNDDGTTRNTCVFHDAATMDWTDTSYCSCDAQCGMDDCATGLAQDACEAQTFVQMSTCEWDDPFNLPEAKAVVSQCCTIDYALKYAFVCEGAFGGTTFDPNANAQGNSCEEKVGWHWDSQAKMKKELSGYCCTGGDGPNLDCFCDAGETFDMSGEEKQLSDHRSGSCTKLVVPDGESPPLFDGESCESSLTKLNADRISGDLSEASDVADSLGSIKSYCCGAPFEEQVESLAEDYSACFCPSGIGSGTSDEFHHHGMEGSCNQHAAMAVRRQVFSLGTDPFKDIGTCADDLANIQPKCLRNDGSEESCAAAASEQDCDNARYANTKTCYYTDNMECQMQDWGEGPQCRGHENAPNNAPGFQPCPVTQDEKECNAARWSTAERICYGELHDAGDDDDGTNGKSPMDGGACAAVVPTGWDDCNDISYEIEEECQWSKLKLDDDWEENCCAMDPLAGIGMCDGVDGADLDGYDGARRLPIHDFTCGSMWQTIQKDLGGDIAQLTAHTTAEFGDGAPYTTSGDDVLSICCGLACQDYDGGLAWTAATIDEDDKEDNFPISHVESCADVSSFDFPTDYLDALGLTNPVNLCTVYQDSKDAAIFKGEDGAGTVEAVLGWEKHANVACPLTCNGDPEASYCALPTSPDVEDVVVEDVVVEDVVVEIEMVLTFEEELSDDDQTDACAALVTGIADVDASVNENYITCDMSLQSRRSRHLLSFVYDTDMTITIPASVVAAAGGVATVSVLQAIIADPVALEASVTASVAEIGGGAVVSGIETEVSGVDDDVDVDNSSSLNGASLFVVFGAMLVARF